ncbi:MAG: hypothetical protein SGJ24_00540 [Chloroflexota bacterium]|nr:hypothetical protein [Chloroflexota bacterium]
MLVILALTVLTACDQVPPSPTPTRVLSAPTLAASPVILPYLPTLPPFEMAEGDLTAASLPRDAVLPPLTQGTRASGTLRQAITIALSSGVPHPGDLYIPQGESGSLTPGVLLLADDPLQWGDLPMRLRDRGISALVTTIPVGATIADFTALLASLGGASDPGHLAVAGIGRGADAAVVGCAADLQCDAVVTVGGTRAAIESALAALAPRPIWREPDGVIFEMPLKSADAETLAAWLEAGLG